MSKIKRVVDAAQVLGMRRGEIRKIFEDRGQGKLYKDYLRKNRFQSFTISENMEQSYKDLARKHGIDNPLNKDVRKRIKKIIGQLRKQKLNSDYIITESDWMSALPAKGTTQVAQTVLPPTPGVDPGIVGQGANLQANRDVMQTGLTSTEQALLSNEEKGIKLRQRGLA